MGQELEDKYPSFLTLQGTILRCVYTASERIPDGMDGTEALIPFSNGVTGASKHP